MENPILNIIEKVKTFTLDSLVKVAMNRVNRNPPVHQPWILLAYLEIVYKEADNNKFKFAAKNNDFNCICQQLFELMDKQSPAG